MASTEQITQRVVGRVREVQGQVVSVLCENSYRPPIRELLLSEKDNSVRFEAYAYENDRSLKCLLFSDNSMVGRGDIVISTGQEIMVPVGTSVLGRTIDLFGTPEDGQGPIESAAWKSIHSSTIVTFADSFVKPEILETGIKVIDFFTPIPKGGKLLLVGGAGVGKTVLLSELLQGMLEDKESVAIFAGIGERSREGHELWRWLHDTGTLDRVVLMMGAIHRNAAVRFRTADAATALVEYYRDDERKNVIFFVDNVYRFLQAGSELSSIAGEMPSEFGYQPMLQSDIARFEDKLKSSESNFVTSVQTMYVPADEMADPTISATIPYVDAALILSRAVAQQGRYPAIDFMRSRSQMIDKTIIGTEHYDAVTRSFEVLSEHERLSRIVSIVGKDELSEEKRVRYERGQKLLNYFTQPFFSTEVQTGRKGQRVTKKQTVLDVLDILNGKYDHVSTESFMYRGRAGEHDTVNI